MAAAEVGVSRWRPVRVKLLQLAQTPGAAAACDEQATPRRSRLPARTVPAAALLALATVAAPADAATRLCGPRAHRRGRRPGVEASAGGAAAADASPGQSFPRAPCVITGCAGANSARRCRGHHDSRADRHDHDCSCEGRVDCPARTIGLPPSAVRRLPRVLHAGRSRRGPRTRAARANRLGACGLAAPPATSCHGGRPDGPHHPPDALDRDFARGAGAKGASATASSPTFWKRLPGSFSRHRIDHVVERRRQPGCASAYRAASVRTSPSR